MSFSYNFGANPQIDAPRMLVADTDSTHPIFQDSEILMAYTIDTISYFPAVSTNVASAGATPSYRRCAAVLIDALAANKARLSSALEVLDIKINPDRAAAALQKQAQYLRDVEADSGAFGIAEMYVDEFTGRQRIWKQLLRLEAV